MNNEEQLAFTQRTLMAIVFEVAEAKRSTDNLFARIAALAEQYGVAMPADEALEA